ncbi:DUF3152 domain-containing protein [Streptomyces sp. NPDC048438]|uniref:DUF3152 domain-containing protein n=1 Tax=Streptomyces sp. NPDC048438 TaxID=3365551 RepID=UPI00371EAD4B
MGRHSRKGPEATRRDTGTAAGTGAERGTGRRGRDPVTPPQRDGHSLFHEAPQVRGGHPEQREPGGGWGTDPQPRHDGRRDPESPGAQELFRARQDAMERQRAAQQASGRRTAGPQTGSATLIPGPRREFLEAFDTAPSRPAPEAAPEDADRTPMEPGGPDEALAGEDTPPAKGGKGRAFTGIAAAAVTTVLAVVVAGQVAQDSGKAGDGPQTTGVDRQDSEDASRSVDRATPEVQRQEVKPLSYAQKMATAFPLAPDLEASGKFEAVPGLAKAPGKGHKYRYRIDVEQGMGLDAGLFAEAVQKTLNDDRSWAHNGTMTFERISSGEPDFVITLASPGTTGVWCAKSGLDTTEDNVSCDSAATDRVMINAYRWAQGASTFGADKLLPYRQMLINHEVGHRLGHNHVSCRTPGALAPVMQQQTKTLNLDGIKCRPNPWVYPGS